MNILSLKVYIAAASRDDFIELTNYIWELPPSSVNPTGIAKKLVWANLRASYYILYIYLLYQGDSGPIQLITWISIT